MSDARTMLADLLNAAVGYAQVCPPSQGEAEADWKWLCESIDNARAYLAQADAPPDVCRLPNCTPSDCRWPDCEPADALIERLTLTRADHPRGSHIDQLLCDVVAGLVERNAEIMRLRDALIAANEAVRLAEPLAVELSKRRVNAPAPVRGTLAPASERPPLVIEDEAAAQPAPLPADALPCEHSNWRLGVICPDCGQAPADAAAQSAPLPAPQYDEYVIRNERRGTPSDPRAAAPARDALADRLRERANFLAGCSVPDGKSARLLREAAAALAQRDTLDIACHECGHPIESEALAAAVSEGIERARRDVPRAEPREPYRAQVIEEPCDQCGKGKMWTVVDDDDDTAIGVSYEEQCDAEETATLMNSCYAKGFADAAPQERSQRDVPRMADAAEMLWVVLANVSGGDWTKQTQEWQDAAARWRDNYFAALRAAPQERSQRDDDARDAARYRWLRDPRQFIAECFVKPDEYYAAPELKSADALDAAIDAVMKRER